MRESLRAIPDVPRPVPPGLVSARVNASTGLLAQPGDTATVTEYFFGDKLPAASAGAANPGSAGAEPLF